jgi:outer membrane lipoprotein-sorting protein
MRYSILLLSVVLLTASYSALADNGQDALQKALDKCARQHTEIRDMTIIQEITIPAPDGTLNAEQKSYEKGEMSRMEMTMKPPAGADTSGMPPSMGTITTISDGKSTWLISPMTGKQEVPEKGDPSSANCWGLKFEQAKVTGSETIDGRECWIVESGKPDSITDRYWLDKAKYDVLKGESKDQEGHILRWSLSDFRPILGAFEYPYKMDVLSGDTVVASMTVSSVAVNTGLADSLFDPDKVEVNQSDLQEMLRKLMQEQGQDSTEAPDSAEPPQK